MWDDLTVFANGSLVKSLVHLPSDLNRPLQGQSPYTFNAGATYSHRPSGLDATVTVSRVGTRIAFVGLNYESSIWEKPRTVIDASVSYRRNRWTVKGTVGDLLAQQQIFFYLYGDVGAGARRDFLGTPVYKPDTDVAFYTSTYGRTVRLTLIYTL